MVFLTSVTNNIVNTPATPPSTPTYDEFEEVDYNYTPTEDELEEMWAHYDYLEWLYD